MNTWIRVCSQSELLPGEFKVVYDGDVPIAVFNINGDLYALEDVCTHDGGELTGGTIEGIRSNVRATARASTSAQVKYWRRRRTSQPPNFRSR